jgi:hypothetical protein
MDAVLGGRMPAAAAKHWLQIANTFRLSNQQQMAAQMEAIGNALQYLAAGDADLTAALLRLQRP